MKKGDVDRSGEVNAKDALYILKYDVGLLDLSDKQKELAEVEEDGEVNAKDALCILKYDVGLINGFTPEDFQKAWEEQMEQKFGVSKKLLDIMGVEWYRRTDIPPESYMVDSPVRCDLQGYNQCWAYSIAMILRYLGEDITGEAFFEEFPFKSEDNTAIPEYLADYLRTREGYNVHLYMGDQMDLKDAVSKYGIVMLFLHTSPGSSSWHYMDLTGYDKQYYYFSDPLSSLPLSDRYNQLLYPEELEEIWHTEYPEYSYLFYVLEKE